LVLEFEEIKHVVESGGRIKVRRVSGKPYLYPVYPDGSERCAGRLDKYPEDVRAWIESVRRSRAGAGGEGGQSGNMASVQTQTPGQQQEPRVKVEGGRIIVEREVELETIWDIKRVALDPRVYILYAYAQKYLGYPGSLGEFVSDCTVLFFKEKGIEVTLKLPERAQDSLQPPHMETQS
jgi:hypothetical protein